MTTSVSSTQALCAFAGTESVEVSRFVKPVEDTKCAGTVALCPPDDDPIRPVGLDRNLVASFQSGTLERLNRQRDLMLRRDSGHTFTLQ